MLSQSYYWLRSSVSFPYCLSVIWCLQYTAGCTTGCIWTFRMLLLPMFQRLCRPTYLPRHEVNPKTLKLVKIQFSSVQRLRKRQGWNNCKLHCNNPQTSSLQSNYRQFKRLPRLHYTVYMSMEYTVGGEALWLAVFVAWTKLTHVGPGQYLDGLGLLSLGGYTILVHNQPTRSTQPCIPPGSLNRVPASAGVKAVCHLCRVAGKHCVIPYGVWVPIMQPSKLHLPVEIFAPI